MNIQHQNFADQATIKAMNQFNQFSGLVSAQLLGGQHIQDDIYKVKVALSSLNPSSEWKQAFNQAIGNAQVIESTFTASEQKNQSGLDFVLTGCIKKLPEKYSLTQPELASFYDQFVQAHGRMLTMSNTAITKDEFLNKSCNVFMSDSDKSLWNLDSNAGGFLITKQDSVQAFTQVLSSATTQHSTSVSFQPLTDGKTHGEMVAYVFQDNNQGSVEIRAGISLGEVKDSAKDNQFAVLCSTTHEGNLQASSNKINANYDIISTHAVLARSDIVLNSDNVPNEQNVQNMLNSLNELHTNPTWENRLKAYVQLHEIHPEAAEIMKKEVTARAFNFNQQTPQVN